MEKFEQYEVILAEVCDNTVGLGGFNTVFLSNMVLRKIRHPEEGIEEIVAKTQQIMRKRYSCKQVSEAAEEKMRVAGMEALNKTPDSYGKNSIMDLSVPKMLQNLEKALKGANLPDFICQKMKEDEDVNVVFDYLVRISRERLEELANN